MVANNIKIDEMSPVKTRMSFAIIRIIYALNDICERGEDILFIQELLIKNGHRLWC